MFIRRKLNKSGTFSVQVLDKRHGRSVLVRSFGASKIEEELMAMEREASDFIMRYGGQEVIDFEGSRAAAAQNEADGLFGRIVDIRQDAPRIILGRIYDDIYIVSIRREDGIIELTPRSISPSKVRLLYYFHTKIQFG